MENLIALGIIIIWAVIGAIAYAVIAQRRKSKWHEQL